MAYYLAQHKKLRSQTQNLNIYLVHKNQKIQDVDQRDVNGGSLSRMGFWARFAGHKLA